MMHVKLLCIYSNGRLMIKYWIDDITERLATLALWLFIAGVICCILFFMLMATGTDLGFFAILFFLSFTLAFLISILNMILRIFTSKSFSKSFFISLVVLLLSAIPTLMLGGIFFLGVPARQAREKANSGTYNLRILGESFKEYTKKHDGYLPEANSWCDQLLADKGLSLAVENFHHPKAKELGLDGKCHFTFNENLSGRKLSEISDNVVLLFEADGDWNFSGGSKLLNTRYNKDGYITVMFVSQKTADYWYDKEALRKFKNEGFGRASMYYEQPCWKP
ncbi:MAG: hypothetical protein K8R02_04940 [Anaerohalosphaeraceae bacterium]|nr:hypothetical protein [Anaerohalosphaeraceae bacterium]